VTDLEFNHCSGENVSTWLVSASIDRSVRVYCLYEAHAMRDRNDGQSRWLKGGRQAPQVAIAGEELEALNRYSYSLGEIHNNSIVDIAISRNDRYLLTGGLDGQVILWKFDELVFRHS
jgi:WD domain, G-beta repeat